MSSIVFGFSLSNAYGIMSKNSFWNGVRTEDGVRNLERTCRALCEAVIGIYFAQGILYKCIDAQSLPVLLGPVFYQNKL